MMGAAPDTASATNHTTMIGPKARPTFAVPLRWIQNSTTITARVTGITARLKVGSSSSRPSTALSTEMAGVIRASQKNSAVPISARLMTIRGQRPIWFSRRCASASSARMPPSPSLSARIITITYLSVTEMASDQKISDSTPRIDSAPVAPETFSDWSKAYKGLVPMSP